MANSEPALMSKLDNINRDYVVPNFRVRDTYDLVADSVKATMITNLISCDPDTDIEFMIDMANAAFASLRSFQSNFCDLYGVVKDFIRYNCIASEAKKELVKNIIARLDSSKSGYDWKDVIIRYEKAFFAWHITGVELSKAREDLSAHGSRKYSEEDLASKREKVLTLEGKLAQLEKSFIPSRRGYVMSIVKNEMEEERFSKGYVDAVAGIERTKAELNDFLCSSDSD